MLFRGEYNHTIDSKGRLIVPSKLREQLGDEFVVTRGMDGCLFAYDNSAWQSFEEELSKLPITNSNARTMKRFFLAGACGCEVDKQGRILIPSVLREHAKLEKDITLAGVGDHIEIWDKQTYAKKNAEDFIDIDSSLEGLGI